jgi:hypothetical protein
MWAHARQFVAPVRTGPAEEEEVLMVDASKKPAAKNKTAAVRRPKRCNVPDCEAEVYHRGLRDEHWASRRELADDG